MKYRFFTLKQAENALRLSEKSIAPQTDAIFRPTRLEQMIFEDAGGDAENKALTELFHLLYARNIVRQKRICVSRRQTAVRQW